MHLAHCPAEIHLEARGLGQAQPLTRVHAPVATIKKAVAAARAA